MFRVGFGYDVHRLVEGRPLVIGGCRIPHRTGLLGHSDADVLVHAMMDAFLGAIGKGDIGQHFPDTDPSFKDADSLVLMKKVIELVRRERYSVNNVDATIVAEKPKLAPHIPEMKERIAAALQVHVSRINIKATTSERMGFCGREEGIAAYAVVSLMASKG